MALTARQIYRAAASRAAAMARLRTRGYKTRRNRGYLPKRGKRSLRYNTIALPKTRRYTSYAIIPGKYRRR